MLLSSYKENFIQKSLTVTDREEAQLWFFMCLEYLMNLSKMDFLTKEFKLTEEQLLQWNQVLNQLIKHQPIQYIFGKAHFYGYDFKVNNHTLIPRRETEELVEWILETMAENKYSKEISMLDIGTGSGCIPITLFLNRLGIRATAMDISAEALKVAKENAKRFNAEVKFIQADVLSENYFPKMDVIVSNPPYVRNLEKAEIQSNVLNYEPHTALFVSDDDPLIFYRKIAELAEQSLSKGGYLFFEINQYLGAEMVDMMHSFDFENIQIKKDMQGNERMLRAVKK